jgi:hypothetical protein
MGERAASTKGCHPAASPPVHSQPDQQQNRAVFVANLPFPTCQPVVEKSERSGLRRSCVNYYWSVCAILPTRKTSSALLTSNRFLQPYDRDANKIVGRKTRRDEDGRPASRGCRAAVTKKRHRASDRFGPTAVKLELLSDAEQN